MTHIFIKKHTKSGGSNTKGTPSNGRAHFRKGRGEKSEKKEKRAVFAGPIIDLSSEFRVIPVENEKGDPMKDFSFFTKAKERLLSFVGYHPTTLSTPFVRNLGYIAAFGPILDPSFSQVSLTYISVMAAKDILSTIAHSLKLMSPYAVMRLSKKDHYIDASFDKVYNKHSDLPLYVPIGLLTNFPYVVCNPSQLTIGMAVTSFLAFFSYIKFKHEFMGERRYEPLRNILIRESLGVGIKKAEEYHVNKIKKLLSNSIGTDEFDVKKKDGKLIIIPKTPEAEEALTKAHRDAMEFLHSRHPRPSNDAAVKLFSDWDVANTLNPPKTSKKSDKKKESKDDKDKFKYFRSFWGRLFHYHLPLAGSVAALLAVYSSPPLAMSILGSSVILASIPLWRQVVNVLKTVWHYKTFKSEKGVVYYNSIKEILSKNRSPLLKRYGKSLTLKDVEFHLGSKMSKVFANMDSNIMGKSFDAEIPGGTGGVLLSSTMFVFSSLSLTTASHSPLPLVGTGAALVNVFGLLFSVGISPYVEKKIKKGAFEEVFSEALNASEEGINESV